MIDISKYINESPLKEYCLFRFEFDFIGSVAGFDIVGYLYNVLLTNQDKSVANQYIKPFISRNTPFSAPLQCEYPNMIVANSYNVLCTEIEPTGKVSFEYVEFTDQHIQLPNIGVATASFAVILKTYLDILNKLPKLQVQLKFSFESTNPTYYYPNYDIWGNEYCPFENALIKSQASFFDVLDEKTIFVDVIQRFFEQFTYPGGYYPTHVTANNENVDRVLREMFK